MTAAQIIVILMCLSGFAILEVIKRSEDRKK